MIKILRITYECLGCGQDFIIDREIIIDEWSISIKIIKAKHHSCGSKNTKLKNVELLEK